MLRALAHNTLLVASLAVGATVTGSLSHAMVTERGAHGPLVFGANTPVLALAAVVASVIVATALAIVVTRYSNVAVGLFVLGGVLFGLAWRTNSVRELEQNGGGLLAAALEDVLWSLLLAGASFALFRIGGPLRDTEPTEDGSTPSPFRSLEAAKSMVAGLAILPVVLFIAQTMDKGQLIGAAFCGGMVVGLVGRLVAPHIQPILLVSATMLAAAVGHGWVAMRTGGDFSDLVRSGELPALGRPMPIQYAAGVAMGVAVGLGWAKSFMQPDPA